MRVLIAPGAFGDELSAVQAAEAIAQGWSRRAPDDELVLAPVCDGGAGLVDVLERSLGGRVITHELPDLYGARSAGRLLVAGDTAYVETAPLVGPRSGPYGDAETATSASVGRLVAEAVARGVERVVVGVGGSGVLSNDGGAGLLAGLGATSDPPGALTTGPAGLAALRAVDVTPAVRALASTRVILATDDDVPLLGLLGTTNTDGAARGIAAERIPLVDKHLEALAGLVEGRHGLLKGAGAGGGIGFALLALGAVRAAGLGTVTAEIGLGALAGAADLVVTGEEALDFAPGSGWVSGRVAAISASAVRPCIALANRVKVGARETRGMGIESVYAVQDLAAAASAPNPAARLAVLAERVARTWSWSR